MDNRYNVSVVIPMYNVEDYLEECLDSIEAQTIDSLEVLLVDDGSTDGSAEIAKRFADRLPNFKYYYKENGGLGHARNYGTDRAQGEYITYCDSDDIIPPRAYEKMYALARKWDCDIVSGDVDRFDSTRHFASSLHRLAFEKASEHENVYENPRLLFDTIAPNKLYRASFLRASGVRFPEGMLYEDIPTVIPLVCMTRKYAHLNEVVYNWREREGAAAKSITQRRTEWRNFSDRLKALKMVDEFFAEHVRDERLIAEKEFKWLSLDLRMFINTLPIADDKYRQDFIDAIVPYIEGIGQEAFDRLPAIDRVKYYYLRQRDMDGLLEYLEFAFIKAAYNAIPLKKSGERYYGRFPFKVPIEYTDMTQEIFDAGCVVSVNRAELTENEGLRIEGDAFLQRFDAAKNDRISIRAFLVSDEDNSVVEELPAAVAASIQPTTQWARCLKYGFVNPVKREQTRFGVDLDAEAMRLLKPGSYHIELSYERKDIRVERVYAAMPDRAREAHPDALFHDARRYVVDYDENKYLRFVVSEIDDRIVDSVKMEGERIVLMNGSSEVASYDLECSDLNHLRAFAESISREEHVCSLRCDEIRPFAGMSVRVSNTTDGHLCLEGYPESAISASASFEGGVFSYEIQPMSGCQLPSELVPIFIGDKFGTRVDCSLATRRPDGTWHCEIDVSDRKAAEALRVDSYRLRLIDETGLATPMPVLSERRYTVETRKMPGQKYKYSLTLSGYEGFGVSRAWHGLESTRHRRDVMQRMVYKPLYDIARFVLPMKENMIVLESYWGTQVGCSPAGMGRYLTRDHPEVECVWSLVDERTPIEGDVRKVRKGTLPYYLAIAQTHVLMNNVNFEDWYVKRPGQIEIQTTHGTPLKTVGFAAPDEFSTEEELERFANRCARWDYLVTPGPLTEEILKDNYRFERSFLRTGFPRNDTLFERNNPEEIAQLREKFGVPQDKKLILYAPTWRVRNHFDLRLDLTAMIEKLGDRYAIGLRPHHFSLPGLDFDTLDSRVIDLASGPTSEDCYLMADVVITDYSSLMFDVALLDKPMIFFTYDLGAYRDRLRGFNLDFEREAPGPLLQTSEEVIEAIDNLENTVRDYADAYAAFKNGYCGYEDGHACEKIFREVFGR